MRRIPFGRDTFLDMRSLYLKCSVPGEPLAQSVEHLTFNQRVVGSTPTRLTRLRVPIV